jgi:hypothetical protein
MGIMIIELVGSRIVAKYFGNSLYTWTTVIGVVLGGISLGNYIGGRIADRFDPRKSVGILLLVAAALTFMILGLDSILQSILLTAGGDGVNSDNIFQIIFWIVVLFFLPATALGTIAPVMAKFALEMSDRVGNTVGSIYAVSAMGSIGGTFLAGFVLIPLLGVTRIIFLVGGVVALLSLLTGGFRWISGAAVAAVLVSYFLTPGAGIAVEYPVQEEDAVVLYETESQYAHIEVKDVERQHGTERQLVMDGLIHNRYDLSDPENLLYNYERIFGAVTDWYVEDRGSVGLDALTLGGGAMLFPEWLEERYRMDSNEVVEIDPEVVEIAYEYFGIERGGSIDVEIGDARGYVNSILGEKRFDIVYTDAFNSYSIPSHLTTKEFMQTLKRVMEPGGMMVSNAIDVFRIGKFLNAFVNTSQEVFENVAVYKDYGATLDQRLTFVIVASDEELPGEVVRTDEGAVGETVAEARLQDLEERNGEFVLTDDHAPVDNFMAPVFWANVD